MRVVVLGIHKIARQNRYTDTPQRALKATVDGVAFFAFVVEHLFAVIVSTAYLPLAE